MRGFLYDYRGATKKVSENIHYVRDAATAHVRLDGHERLCVQNAEHTQKALHTLADAVKTLTETVGCTNVRLHARIDRLMWGMGGLIVSAAGAAILVLVQFLWEAMRYKAGG